MHADHIAELDDRIRSSFTLTPDTAERLQALRPTLGTASSVPNVRSWRSRSLVIPAVAVIALVGSVTALASPAIRDALWDSDSSSSTTPVISPGGTASENLLAAEHAQVTTSAKDIARLEMLAVRSSTGGELPVPIPGAPYLITDAPSIKRNLVFIRTTNGGFCYLVGKGSVGHGDCVREFPSNGVLMTSGAVAGRAIAEGLVADDVTKLELMTSSGSTIEVPIDNGLFAWSEPIEATQVEALIATRRGERIRQVMTINHDFAQEIMDRQRAARAKRS